MIPTNDMISQPSHESITGACRHCGVAISAVPLAREDDEFCCEGCFLAARRRRSLPAVVDEEQDILGEALVAALDARERETGMHSKRVACHTLVLARHFSSDPRELQQVYLGALLHDIGKIGIPDSILLQEGPLSDAEWQIMRTHPEIGHRILAGVPFMDRAAELVLSHEERYDGTGYPRGLAGTAIPLWARLFAVIDALDAITSDRPYRRSVSFAAARAEIVRQSGIQFDPRAVEVFVAEEEQLREMVELKCGTPMLHHPAVTTRTDSKVDAAPRVPPHRGRAVPRPGASRRVSHASLTSRKP